MAVILSNCDLAVVARAHPAARDEHGVPVLSDAGAVTRGPFPGAAKEQVDQGTWGLRLDPRCWPVRPGDTVTDGSRSWTVQTALQSDIPGYDAVDYVAVTAVLEPPEVP